MDGNAGNNLIELVTSWQFREAVQLALDDEDALVEVVRLLRSDDLAVVVGALSVLEEAIPQIGDGAKFRVLREGFDDLLRLVRADVPVARRAVGVLRQLLSSVPLSRNQLVKLVEVLAEVAGGENGPILLPDLFELASKLRPIFFDELVDPIRKMVTSDNPNVALLGAKLAVTMEIPAFIGWRDVLDALSRVLRGENAVAAELALEVVSNLGSLLLEAPILCVIKSLYSPLKMLSRDGSDAVIRGRAMGVFKRFREAVFSYYRTRPSEARANAEELLREGFTEEAILVASAGGYSIDLLKGKIEGLVLTPRFRPPFAPG